VKKYAALLWSILLVLSFFAFGAQAMQPPGDATPSAAAALGWYQENHHILQRDPAYRQENPLIFIQFSNEMNELLMRIHMEAPALERQGLLETAAARWLEELLVILRACYGDGAHRLAQLRELVDSYQRLERDSNAYQAAPPGGGHLWQASFEADIARRREAHLASWHSEESEGLRALENDLDGLISLYAVGCGNLERIVSRCAAVSAIARADELEEALNAMSQGGERPGGVSDRRWALLLEAYARHGVDLGFDWESADDDAVQAFLRAYGALLSGLTEAMHQTLPPDPQPEPPPEPQPEPAPVVPSAPAPWYACLPAWLQWVLRWLLFGWIWM